MTLNELVSIKNYVLANAGNIPLETVWELYLKVLNGADKFILGVEFDGNIYMDIFDEIDLRYCSCQKRTHN